MLYNSNPRATSLDVFVEYSKDDGNKIFPANICPKTGLPYKPFASLDAAVRYVCAYYDGPLTSVDVILKSNVPLDDDLDIYAANFRMITIKGNGHTIDLHEALHVHSGTVQFSDVHFHANDIDTCVLSEGIGGSASHVVFRHNVSVSGKAKHTLTVNRGNITIMHPILGSIIGKRYLGTNGAKIMTGGLGRLAIPGTLEGALDKNSSFV